MEFWLQEEEEEEEVMKGEESWETHKHEHNMNVTAAVCLTGRFLDFLRLRFLKVVCGESVCQI